MKYFRTYPWGLQLLLFLLMVFTMMMFIVAMMYMLIPRFTGYDLTQLTKISEHSPQSLIQASLTSAGISHIFTFLVPAFLFAYLAHPRPEQYLGLRKPGKPIQLLLSVLVIVSLIPVLVGIENLVSKINFGPAVKAQQQENDNVMKAFLIMPNFLFFLKAFVIIAVIPALGEEMFFRGVLMRFAKQRSRTMVLPIIFTAAVFAYAHTNIYGYTSIFIAGVVLALIYYFTGSLWCSILAHLTFNGLQVVLSYIGNGGAGKDLADDSVPAYMVIAGLVLFAVFFYLLIKNKTPLPGNWSDDFDASERAIEEA